MTVNKGLKALAESDPDFSDQHLENAIIELRIGWVAKSIDLDTEIQNNSVLTLSQKNDLKDLQIRDIWELVQAGNWPRQAS